MMDKDDKLFEDQIEEDDDLLNISLDELSTGEIDIPVGEEPDEDIIDLIDLLEKGDGGDLQGIDDDTDLLEEDDLLTEEVSQVSDEGIENISSPDLEMDDLQLDSDISGLDSIPEEASDDDFAQLLADESLDDLEIGQEETRGDDDELEQLLEGAELEDLSDNAGFESDGSETMDLQMEDIFVEDNEPDQAGFPGDTAVDDVQENLFDDLGLEDISDEDILESEDEIFNEADNELDNAIVSSDDVQGEEFLWESDLQSEATGMEEDIDSTDVNFDEIDDIPLDGESLEELLSDSNMEQPVVVGADSEGMRETISGDEGKARTSDDSLVESDETAPDEESLDDFFSESDLREDTGDSELDSGVVEDLMAYEDSDAGTDDASENIEALDDLFFEEDEDVPSIEENVVPGDIPDDIAEETGPVEEALQVASDEEIAVEDDTQISVETGFTETQTPDDISAAEDAPAAELRMPVISEEKVEEIVRDVVGEVVEKIAREVFAEVAERVISEAIDSLKKSLESDSE